MTVTADTSNTRLVIAQEINWGETPSSPAMTELRLTAESVGEAKDNVVSEAIRDDRMREIPVVSSKSVSGSLDFELAAGEFDFLLEAALQNVTQVGQITGVSLTFATDTITAPSASDWDDFTVGQWIRISGASNTENNGIFQITAISGVDATVNVTSLVSETTSAATIDGARLVNGKAQPSFVLEKQFQDVAEFVYANGLVVGGMSLSLSTDAIVTGSFDLEGKSVERQVSSIAGSVTDAGNNPAFVTSSNFGQLLENDQPLDAVVQSISLTVSNNLRVQRGVGSASPVGIAAAAFEVTGDLSLLFSSSGLYEKFLDHTPSSLSFRLSDAADNVMVFSLPSLVFEAGNPVASGAAQDVVLPLSFRAGVDAVTGAVMQVDFL